MAHEDGASRVDSEIVDVDFRGRWLITEFSIDGDRHFVVVGENTRQTPWIEAGEFLKGDLGCNTMSGGDPAFKVEGNVLHPGQIYTTAGRCDDKLMAVEEAFNALMADGQVRVEVADQSMTWTRGDVSMTFAAG